VTVKELLGYGVIGTQDEYRFGFFYLFFALLAPSSADRRRWRLPLKAARERFLD